jgi:hypothetical protein
VFEIADPVNDLRFSSRENAKALTAKVLFAQEVSARPEAAALLTSRPDVRLHARQLTVCPVSGPEARAFLERYHIQGAPGSNAVAVGLRHGGDLVAVMTFASAGDRRGASSGNEDGVSLTRYATSVSIPGGASRLLSHWRKANPDQPLFSYSDPRVFSGGMYAALGFVVTKLLAPDYRVMLHGVLRHKSACQRKALERIRLSLGRGDVAPFDAATDPRTEWQMEDALGIARIWTPGLVRWHLPALNREHLLVAYRKLCVRGAGRSKAEGYERHHIQPRAWGGDDSPENLVYLTTREHYVAHRLLAKAFPFDKAMVQSVWLMAQRSKIPGSRVYEMLRAQVAVASSERLKTTRAVGGVELEAKRVAGIRAYHATPEAAVARAAQAAKTKWNTEAAREAKRRAVICKESGAAFPSLIAAAAWCKSQGHEKAAANNIGIAASTGGRVIAYDHYWEYADGKPRVSIDSTRMPRKLPGVIRVSTGEVFRSAYLAAQAMGSPSLQANIIRVCREGAGTAGGERWEFDGATETSVRPAAVKVTQLPGYKHPLQQHPPVRRLSTGVVYRTAYKAAEAMGNAKRQGNILRACLTRTNKAFGENWEFFYL